MPGRINGIAYDSNFLNNCNFMFLVLVIEIVLAGIFLLISLLIPSSSLLSQIASRLIK